MTKTEDRPITWEECKSCSLRQEVRDLKGWLKALVILALTQLLSIIGMLAVIIFKMLPAYAHAAVVMK